MLAGGSAGATGGEQALNQEPAKSVRRRAGPAGLQAGNRDSIERLEQESALGEHSFLRDLS